MQKEKDHQPLSYGLSSSCLLEYKMRGSWPSFQGKGKRETLVTSQKFCFPFPLTSHPLITWSSSKVPSMKDNPLLHSSWGRVTHTLNTCGPAAIAIDGPTVDANNNWLKICLSPWSVLTVTKCMNNNEVNYFVCYHSPKSHSWWIMHKVKKAKICLPRQPGCTHSEQYNEDLNLPKTVSTLQDSTPYHWIFVKPLAEKHEIQPGMVNGNWNLPFNWTTKETNQNTGKNQSN